MMLNRRMLMAAGLASPVALNAQVLPPDGFATPAGTFPFAPDVYRARREALMATLKDGISVVYGSDQVPDSGPFVQDGDFAWLTGIVDEPGAVLLLAPTERLYREFLFLRSRNPETERWEVERLPLGSTLERRTGIAKVMRLEMLDRQAPVLAERSKSLHFLGPIASASAPEPKALELYGKIAARVPGTSVKDNSDLLPALRQVKEPRELALIKKATAATARGHIVAMQGIRPGMTEGQLKDILEAGFRAGGGTGLSYDSIVATGRNAASLHYRGRTGAIAAGDMILIDAAASVDTYACDVTRTFPASGRFTDEQRRNYELVLEAQAAAVQALKAGVYYEDLETAAKDVFRKAGRIDDFYHGLGHFVGLDVHDPGDRSKPIPAGAVITVEPGLYVQSGNYGIRVEDLYLVTATGSEHLSKAVPRTVAEVEAVMAGR
jgi:Xaa-Pro aminopeptidase